MPELNEQIYKDRLLPEAYAIASMWLNRPGGWKVLPVQPGSKRLVRGFGPFAGVIESPEDAQFWFWQRGVNLAVVSPVGSVILDFDQISFYESFKAGKPGLAKSYTESTPRGGRHVFLSLENRRELNIPGLLPGCEIKRFCLACPSKLPAGNYEILEDGPILTVSADTLQKVLEPFFDLGHKSTPPAGKRLSNPLKAKNDLKTGLPANLGVITRIKAAWPILSYLTFFEPTLRLEGRGEWRSCLCPWHNDHNPSMRINIVSNTWRCFGCGSYGDVVNWHQLRGNFADQVSAARDLDKYKIQVGM
jgi:hypothetical protein